MLAKRIILFFFYVLAVAVCAPAKEQKDLNTDREDLQTAASHWGGYGGYGGYGWGGYYPHYGGYGWGGYYPHYGYGYGWGWPYGYYGHHGYWW